MITVTVYKRSDTCVGFSSIGHAEYAEEGYDIICAAVSVLTVNAVNSIEQFTEDHFSAKQGDGLLSCMVDEPVSKETQLLLNSTILGLQDIQENYGREYLQLIFEEV